MNETPLIIPGLRKLYDGLRPLTYTLLRIMAAGMMMQFGFKKLFGSEPNSFLNPKSVNGLMYFSTCINFKI